MPTLTSSILTTAASLTASVAYSTLTAIHQNAAEAAVNSTSSSEASSTGGEVELSPEEQTFIYKTFLITGGLIMTINSFIKLLNTKVHGEFRRLLLFFFVCQST
jgi:pantothenate kinase type III